MGLFGGVPSGGKDVGEQDEVILELVSWSTRKLEAVEVAVGDSDQISLTTAVWSHPAVAEASTMGRWVHRKAGIQAESTANVERQHHPITNLEGSDR